MKLLTPDELNQLSEPQVKVSADHKSYGINPADFSGVLLGVDPADVASIDASFYRELRTTDNKTYKTFDNATWVEDEQQTILPDELNYARARIALAQSVPAAGNTEGDRLIIWNNVANLNNNSVAEYDGTDWVYTPLIEGSTYLVPDSDPTYPNNIGTFDGTTLQFEDGETFGSVLLGEEATVYIYDADTSTLTPQLFRKEELIGTVNFYVDSVNGSDSNDGRSLANAFQTIQGALDILTAKYKLIDATVILNIADGVYSAFNTVGFDTSGISGIQIRGNATNVSAVRIDAGNNTGIRHIDVYLDYLIKDLTIFNTRNSIGNSQRGFDLQRSSVTTIGEVEFTGKYNQLFNLNNGGQCSVTVSPRLGECEFNTALQLSESKMQCEPFTLLAGSTIDYTRWVRVGSSSFLRITGEVIDNGATLTGQQQQGSVKGSGQITTDGIFSKCVLGSGRPLSILGGGILNDTTYGINPFTYWQSGLSITQTNTTTIEWTTGTYVEFDNSDRTSETWSPRYLEAGSLTLTAAELAGSDSYYIVLVDGQIQLSTEYANVSILSDRIYLGVIAIDAGAIVSATPLLIEANPFNQSTNILFVGGIVNRANIPAAKAGTRGFSLPAGIFEVTGNNFFTDSFDPHKYIVPEQDTATYDLYRPDGVAITVGETELDFSNAWGNNAVQVVDGNNAAALFLYYVPYRVGNKLVAVIGDKEYNSITVAYRDWQTKEEHVKPAWLGLCKLLGVWIGRVDFTDVTNTNQVAFVPRLDFVDSGGGAGTSISDGVLLEVAPADIATVDAAVFHEFRTTDGEIYKTFDRINWVQQ